MNSTPFLDVVGVGRLELPRGLWLVGRGEGADLRLSSSEVSAQHAWLRRDGRAVWVADASSTNGTWLNGRRLTGEQELHDSDLLEFGPVRAVYRDPAHRRAAPGTQVWRRSAATGVSYGDVSAGTFNHAGRDVNNTYDHRQHNRFEFTTPEGQAINELATGRGVGRAVMVLGLLMSVAGFGIWASVIFRFITAISNEVSSPGVPDFDFRPPSLLGDPVFGDVPLGVVGFALFGCGMVVTVVGMVISRSARERRRSR